MNMGVHTVVLCIFQMKLQMKLNGECLIGGIVKGIVFYRTTGYNDLVASKGKKLHGTDTRIIPFLLPFFSLFGENNTNLLDDGFMKDVY